MKIDINFPQGDERAAVDCLRVAVLGAGYVGPGRLHRPRRLAAFRLRDARLRRVMTAIAMERFSHATLD